MLRSRFIVEEGRAAHPTPRSGRFRPALAVLVLLGACGEDPLSILRPAGPGAEDITHIWWIMFWGSVLILAFMIALSLYAACRDPDRRVGVSSRLLIIGGGLVFPLTVLAALLAYGVRTGHALLPLPRPDPVLRVDVTAHQWWWEVQYGDREAGPLFTANEIYIPAGRPVDFHLHTADVIHSFWVPRLGGKLDAIPGHTNVLRLEADEPGLYAGQCAEFCGAQHARMKFTVEALDEAAFAARLDALAQAGDPEAPAVAAAAQAEPEGAQAFAAYCAECHSTDATRRGGGGPNLAGLSARATLGAGTLPNAPGAVLVWLVDHQQLKPGNREPSHIVHGRDTLEAIARYLEALP